MKDPRSSINPHDLLRIDTSGHLAEFAIRDDSAHLVTVVGGTAIDDNNWHYLVGTRTGTTLRLYVDGNLDATPVTGSTLGDLTLNTTTIATLQNTSVTNYFTGTLDEVAYFPTALDDATIARNYHNATNTTPTVTTYTYNGDGLRTSKTVDGITTNYTWDTTGSLPLLLSDGTTQYIYGPGGAPVEQITGSTPIYYHQDQQGSTRLLTDQNGTAVGTSTYDPYGNTNASTGLIQTPLKYTGQYTDTETGSNYLRNRYYDPATATFLSQDPALASTVSPYAFVAGNPLNESDPTGLKCKKSSWWHPSDWKECIDDTATRVEDVAVATKNAPVTAAAAAINSATGGDCDWNADLTVVCYGGWLGNANPWTDTWTTGSTINTALSKGDFAPTAKACSVTRLGIRGSGRSSHFSRPCTLPIGRVRGGKRRRPCEIQRVRAAGRICGRRL